MTALEKWRALAPDPRPLSGTDRWNIFVSYRSVNRPWVLNLYDVLREHGHHVFLDQCVLRAGDQLTKHLQEALATSQAGVLVWSSASRDSDWIEREYEVMERQAGRKRGFQFVPIRLDASQLPPFAESRIFLDFQAYPDGPNGGELLRLLYAVVGEALSDAAVRFASEQDELSKRESARINAAVRNGNATRLLELAREGGLPWEASSALGCLVAEGLTKLKKYEEALELLGELERRFRLAIRPQQLRALALARRGSDDDLEKAQEILGELYELGQRDPETLGIYGRTWMDRYARSTDPRHLRQSRDLYAEAFASAQDDYYTGINAAAKSVLLGSREDLDKAGKYAEQVQAIVGTQPVDRNYWQTATVAEVMLIQRRYAEAGEIYRAAVAMAPTEIGSHESTWKQACALMLKLGPKNGERVMIRKAFSHLPDCQQL